MPSMTKVKCKQCKSEFTARTADVKRGWGKFCSKSCKATHQEKRTGQYSTYKHKSDLSDGCVIPSFETGYFGHGQD